MRMYMMKLASQVELKRAEELDIAVVRVPAYSPEAGEFFIRENNSSEELNSAFSSG